VVTATALGSPDVPVVWLQVLARVSAEAASRSADRFDCNLPNADSLVCSEDACDCSWTIG
jgi:hypothetical protein